MRMITLEGNRLRDAPGCAAMRQLISSTPNLTKLLIGKNALGSSIAEAIANSPEYTHPSYVLQHLSLERVCLCSAGIAAVSAMLQGSLFSLTELYLGGNGECNT